MKEPETNKIELIIRELKRLFFKSPYNTYKAFRMSPTFEIPDLPEGIHIDLENLIETQWKDEKLKFLKEKRKHYDLVLETYKFAVIDKMELAAKLNEVAWNLMNQPDITSMDLQRITMAIDRVRELERENMTELKRLHEPDRQTTKEHRDNTAHIQSLFRALREEVEAERITKLDSDIDKYIDETE